MKGGKTAPKLGSVPLMESAIASKREPIWDSTSGSRRPGPFSPQSLLAQLARNSMYTYVPSAVGPADGDRLRGDNRFDERPVVSDHHFQVKHDAGRHGAAGGT